MLRLGARPLLHDDHGPLHRLDLPDHGGDHVMAEGRSNVLVMEKYERLREQREYIVV